MRSLNMSVKVKKSELIEKIKKAKAEHMEQYKNALDGWILQMRKASDKVIERIVNGNALTAFPKEFQKLMDVPSSHAGDFEQALQMLEMSIEDEIELCPEDFDQLVLGNWSWKERFVTTNSRYS